LARCRRCVAGIGLRIEAAELDVCRVDALLVAAMPPALAGRMGFIHACVRLIEKRQTLVQALIAMRSEVREARSRGSPLLPRPETLRP